MKKSLVEQAKDVPAVAKRCTLKGITDKELKENIDLVTSWYAGRITTKQVIAVTKQHNPYQWSARVMREAMMRDVTTLCEHLVNKYKGL